METNNTDVIKTRPACEVSLCENHCHIEPQ